MTVGTIVAVGVHARRSLRIRPAALASHSICVQRPVGHRGGTCTSRSMSVTCNTNKQLNTRRDSYDQQQLSIKSTSHCLNNGSRRSLTVSSTPRPTDESSAPDLESQAEGTKPKNKSTSQTEENSTSSAAPVKISMDELLALASCQPTALSLEAMYQYAPKRSNHKQNSDSKNNKFVDIGRLRNAQFLHKELPIRIAQRAIDLLTLPHGLNRTREVQSIANTYLQYLQQLRDFPVPTNTETEHEFTNTLKQFILDRHSIPMAIAQGLQSLKDDRKAPVDARRLAEMEEALNRFFTARVGLRFLVEHHVLSGNDENSDALYRKQLEAEGGLELLDSENHALSPISSEDAEDCCGAIQKNCDPVKEVKRTVARVTRLCRESYGIAPEIEVVDCTPDTDAELLFTYVPHHLRYMLAELLKNSCRATVRK